MVVGDASHRFVAQPLAALHQPPAQVDVLSGVQCLVESTDRQHRRAPAHDRRTRHVGHRPVGPHRRLPLAEVERGADRLVAGDRAAPVVQGDDPRCGHCHGGIAEVPKQGFQPAAPGQHVRVEESHIVGPAPGQPGVAGGGRAPAVVVPDDLNGAGGAVELAVVELSVVHRSQRAVIDDHHPQSAQRPYQPAQPGGVVAHRDHHGDVAVGRAAGRAGVGHRGVEQCAGQLRTGGVTHLQSAAAEHGLGGRGQP